MMTSWTFFATLMGQLTAAVTVGSDAMLNGALTYARPVVLAGAVFWIAFRAVMVANGTGSLRDLYHDMVRIAVVVFLLQVANYNNSIGGLALAIPTEAGNALTAIGANTGNVANGAAFDNVWNAAARAGIAAYNQIPKFSFSSIALWFAVIVYLAIALVAIGVSFLVYLASTILLLLLVKTGPLFVALFAFPPAAKFAAGWVAAVVSAILTQIFTVAILVMFVGIEQATVVRIATGVPGGGAGANFIDTLVTLGEAALLMWLIATLVKQAPSFAQGIAGGVYQNVSSVMSGVNSVGGGIGAAAKGAFNRATGRSGGGGGGGGSAPAARVSRPTGRSLSGA